MKGLKSTSLKSTPPAPLVTKHGSLPPYVTAMENGFGGILVIWQRRRLQGGRKWDGSVGHQKAGAALKAKLQKWGLHPFPLLHLQWVRKPPKPAQPKRRVPAFQSYASCLTSICERTNRYMLSPGINPFHGGGQPSTAVFWEAFRVCSFLLRSPCCPSVSSTDSIPAGREQPSRENDMCRGWMGCDPAGTAGAAGLLFSWGRWLPFSSASASAAQDCERHTLLVQIYSPAFIRKKWVWVDKLFSLSFRRCGFWALLLTNSHLHCCTFSFLLFKKATCAIAELHTSQLRDGREPILPLPVSISLLLLFVCFV